MAKKYDFCGYATKNNLVCTDRLIIRKDAFKDADGKRVPLVWNHMHDDPENVLGHADLKNLDDGVYAYCSFNDTRAAKEAKIAVEHGDISALSIYANHVRKEGFNVIHGAIREVSLVLAGANPGAFIDTVLEHSDGDGNAELEAIMFLGDGIELMHNDEETEVTEKEDNEETPSVEVEHADDEKDKEDEDGETIQDIINSMTEKQQNVLFALISDALEEKNKTEGEKSDMKHNVFDKENDMQDVTISHADMEKVLKSWTSYGSLRNACEQNGIGDITIAHDDTTDTRYGIMANVPAGETYGISALFPDNRNLTNTPEFISRDVEWVAEFMGSVSRSPFARVKSMFADITEDEARAKGYIKGHYKKSEVFPLLKRTTNPTTIYKKQKFDRDDLIDITSFDVVAWIKGEMRTMLNEEVARAALIGDGRVDGTDDKVDEQCIRPIYKDADLFAVKLDVTYNADPDVLAKNTIRAAVKGRKQYKGSGNPILFTTEDCLTDMLLMEDQLGRVIYDTREKLCNALRVRKIVTCELMENVTRTDTKGVVHSLLGIIVNPKDYNFGSDKNAQPAMFDDFDIDYNQMKYLMETRLSGALTRPYSALVLETVVPTEDADGEDGE